MTTASAGIPSLLAKVSPYRAVREPVIASNKYLGRYDALVIVKSPPGTKPTNARQLNVKVGDEVLVTTMANQVRLQVVGLIEQARQAPSLGERGQLWLTLGCVGLLCSLATSLWEQRKRLNKQA